MEGETMSTVLASVSSRKEKAAKAMASLHSHRNLITSCITEWEELERSFGITERALQQKFKELAELEKESDSKMQEARAALDKREEAIAGLEETSLARVKEQKDTAMAAITEERKKFEEERTKWKADKQAAAQATIGASVQDKEAVATQRKGAGKGDMEIGGSTKDASKVADNCPAEDAQQRGQNTDQAPVLKESKQTKDTALNEKKTLCNETIMKDSPISVHNEKKKDAKDKGAVKKAGQHLKNEQLKEGQKKELQGKEVSTNKRKDATPLDEAVMKRQKGVSAPDASVVAGSSNGATSLEEAIKAVKLAAEAPTFFQIKSYVGKMDWEGLREFLVNNRKEAQKLRPELQAALQASSEPCQFLLKVLEGSEGTNRVALNNKIGHACVLLLECLSEVVADPVLGVDYPVVPSDSKEIARVIARRWKSKLELHNEDGHALGSHLFLQLLASFGIGTDYSDEDLLHYVVSASRRIKPALCRSLGLTEKIPVIVDRLVKEGKQMEAIILASAFDILDKFQITTLLKAYLEDSRKEDGLGLKRTGVLTKQITALKNVVKVIEKNNLDSQFPLEDLRVRITVLTQERAELKKTSTNPKQDDNSDKVAREFESGRPNITINSHEEAGVLPGVESDQGKHGSYVSALERGHYAPGDLGHSFRGDYTPTDIGRPLFPPYNIDSHYRYERRPESAYDGYGFGRSPVSLSNSYPYLSRDGTGTLPSALSSHIPTTHSYGGMSRDELSNISASRGRPSYSEIPGSSSNYQLGSGLPSSSGYLPYYLR